MRENTPLLSRVLHNPDSDPEGRGDQADKATFANRRIFGLEHRENRQKHPDTGVGKFC
jgi:hypothetical protein